MNKIVREINWYHSEITKSKRLTLDNMTKCGRLLHEQSQKIGKDFPAWLKQNINFPVSNAYRYMKVYRLRKHGLWDNKKSASENIENFTDPKSYTTIKRQNDTFAIAKKYDIPIKQANNIAKAMEAIPEVDIKSVVLNKEMTEEFCKKIRLAVMNAMERAYDLGKRNKLLTISEKRDAYDKIIQMIKKEFC